MAYEEQHQIVAEEEARQKELMEKRKAELSQLLEEVEKTEQTRSRKPSIHQGLHSGRSSQQSIVSHFVRFIMTTHYFEIFPNIVKV